MVATPALDLSLSNPIASLVFKKGPVNGIAAKPNKAETGYYLPLEKTDILKIPYSAKCALARLKEKNYTRGILTELDEKSTEWFGKLCLDLPEILKQRGIVDILYPSSESQLQVLPVAKADENANVAWFSIAYNHITNTPKHCLFFKKDSTSFGSSTKTTIAAFEKAVADKCGVEMAVQLDSIFISRKDDGAVTAAINIDVLQVSYQELVPQNSLFDSAIQNKPVVAGPWSGGLNNIPRYVK